MTTHIRHLVEQFEHQLDALPRSEGDLQAVFRRGRQLRLRRRFSFVGTSLILVIVSALVGARIDRAAPAPPTNPQTSDQVASAATMGEARAAHTATLLADGRVLLTGGLAEGEVFMDTAELYDPVTGSFETLAAPMGVPRAGHVATLLVTGEVLIFGGSREPARAEIFDPETDSFESVGGPVVGTYGMTATTLRDGSVLIAGGGVRKPLSRTFILDPNDMQFKRGPNMNRARSAHIATLLAGGQVLIAGGGNGLRSAELYLPRRNDFVKTRPMRFARHNHGAALLGSGGVLVVGGADENDFGGRYSSAEIYDVRAGRFRDAGKMSVPRYKIVNSTTSLLDGRVLVAGDADRVEIFDPAREEFVRVDGAIDARYFMTATALLDGRVLIAGGYDRQISPTARAWIFSSEP